MFCAVYFLICHSKKFQFSHSKSKVCKTGEKKILFGLFFSDISKNSVFICMFTWVAGSTHNVLLAMNVSLNKNSAECEESFSPSSRK